MPLLQEQPRYSFADYLSWGEDERIEIIGGEAIVAQAAPSPIHQEIVMQITRQIANYLDGKRCKVYPAPFAVRVEDDADTPENASQTVVEPDISIVCDISKIDDKGCKGAPDMIVEVLSPSTTRRDMVTKFNLYQRAGVKEYWIVSPDGKTVLVFTLKNGSFQSTEAYTSKDIAKVHVLDNCTIDLAKVFPQ